MGDFTEAEASMVAYTLWIVLLLSIGQASSKRRDILALEEQGRKDTTTDVTVSIMIWHTQEFEESFNDTSGKKMKETVNEMIQDLNKGFDNSKIPVHFVLHDIKRHPTLSENEDKKATWKNGTYLDLADFVESIIKLCRCCNIPCYEFF